MATAFERKYRIEIFYLQLEFKFILGKHPRVDFLSMSANIPDINLMRHKFIPTYLKDIDVTEKYPMEIIKRSLTWFS